MKRFTPIEIRPFIEGDALKIRDINVDALGTNDLAALDQLACRSWALTGLIEGRVVGIVGFVRQWDKVSTIWTALDKEVLSYGLALTKAARYCVTRAFEETGVRKGYALVEGSVLANLRWARLVGFEVEYCMLDAGPTGSDIYGISYIRRRNGRRRR